jgi:hypothetical protein
MEYDTITLPYKSLLLKLFKIKEAFCETQLRGMTNQFGIDVPAYYKNCHFNSILNNSK